MRLYKDIFKTKYECISGDQSFFEINDGSTILFSRDIILNSILKEYSDIELYYWNYFTNIDRKTFDLLKNNVNFEESNFEYTKEEFDEFYKKNYQHFEVVLNKEVVKNKAKNDFENYDTYYKNKQKLQNELSLIYNHCMNIKSDFILVIDLIDRNSNKSNSFNNDILNSQIFSILEKIKNIDYSELLSKNRKIIFLIDSIEKNPFKKYLTYNFKNIFISKPQIKDFFIAYTKNKMEKYFREKTKDWNYERYSIFDETSTYNCNIDSTKNSFLKYLDYQSFFKILMYSYIKSSQVDLSYWFENKIFLNETWANSFFEVAEQYLEEKRNEVYSNWSFNHSFLYEDILETDYAENKKENLIDWSKIKELNKILEEDIIGQKQAISELHKCLIKASQGLSNITFESNRDKPLGTFMFLGPTGVGKTELVKLLAKEIFGDFKNFKRFNMSEYFDDHTISTLIGSPPGYSGSSNGGLLTNFVKNNPNSIILFDEIEKSFTSKGSTKILDIFLQILDNGTLSDLKGMEVSFKNTIIIFTSNLGPKEEKNISEKEFKNYIINFFNKEIHRPELLGRIGLNNIILFNKLEDPKTIRLIINSKLKKLKLNLLETANLNLKAEKEDARKLVDYIYKNTDFSRGVREILNVIDANLVSKISLFLFENDFIKNNEIQKTLKIKVIDDKFVFELI